MATSSPTTADAGETAGARTALLAGATGLVGRELLRLLGSDPRYELVHVLARRPLGLPTPRKVQWHIAALSNAASVPPADDVYLALGTTIKLAGSQEAFRRVDFDLVVHLAALSRKAGASRLAVVSALGADARSSVFYNRIKGEMEEAVRQLGYPHLVIARPSLLSGGREALGQPARPGERWSLRLAAPLAGWLPASLKPVSAVDVAAGLVRALLEGGPGTKVLTSHELQAQAMPR